MVEARGVNHSKTIAETMIHWKWFGSADQEYRNICATWAARIIWPDGSKDLRYFGEQLCLAVFSGDELIAVMVYHNYEPDAGVIEISGAALTGGLRYWLTRDVLDEMYRYPFEELGVQMVVQRTPAENVRLLKLLGRLGFEFYTIPRLRGRNEDEVVCTLADDKWKEIKMGRSTPIIPPDPMCTKVSDGHIDTENEDSGDRYRPEPNRYAKSKDYWRAPQDNTLEVVAGAYILSSMFDD